MSPPVPNIPFHGRGGPARFGTFGPSAGTGRKAGDPRTIAHYRGVRGRSTIGGLTHPGGVLVAIVVTLIVLLFVVLILAGPLLESIIDRIWPPGGHRRHGAARH